MLKTFKIVIIEPNNQKKHLTVYAKNKDKAREYTLDMGYKNINSITEKTEQGL